MTFNARAFFDACRKSVMGPTLDSDEVSGANVILEAMAGQPLSFTAYALATAWHETAHTLQPIKETGGPSYYHRMYDLHGHRPKVAKALGNTEPGDGIRFAGRGYVQLTGRANYAKAGKKIGVDLIADPDACMKAPHAANIMRWGMGQGWFTGKQFADYLPAGRAANRAEFIAARRIINGSDRAGLIADYALRFQAALQAGNWA